LERRETRFSWKRAKCPRNHSPWGGGNRSWGEPFIPDLKIGGFLAPLCKDARRSAVAGLVANELAGAETGSTLPRRLLLQCERHTPVNAVFL
jgi:hypothetical protein